MRILRTYLLKELLQPTAMALVLFTFVLLVGNLFKLTDILINKGIPFLAILKMFALLIPSLFSYTIPMAVLTGTLMAFGKLSSDREILAMRTSGVSLFSIALPVLFAGFLLSMALVPMNAQIVPWSHYATRQLLLDIGIRNPAAFLEGGTFIREFKPYILFIYQVEGNHLSKVRIYEPRDGAPTRTIVAESGEFISLPEEGRVLLKLYNGTADEPDARDPTKFYKLEFKTYVMNIPIREGQTPQTLGKKPKDMTVEELKTERRRLETQGIDSTPLEAETHRRSALAFSTLAFMLVGLPLGITTRRAQRSIGLGLSVVVFLGYYGLLILGQALAQKGILQPALGSWLGNIVLFIVGGLLLWNTARK